MGRTFSFVVPGKPCPWTAWPRRGPPPMAFQAMQVYQAQIQAVVRHEWGDRPPFICPVVVDTIFHLPRPDGGKPERYPLPTRSHHDPDLDNLRKAAIDALQGIIIKDDVQVIEGKMSKCWCRSDYPSADNPGETIIRIRVVES